ncbi:hypothetical protein G7Y89_g12412 [Cudoniella acicularis]|uniref:Uncharacterized protein n=1 Tax=Cudoniella acicularis TaxID=354080 RepID=A0A8H4VWZ5_9HELO|nr:hypothetical protein G7Y89_g12412 [Cudoniella acicularis]
MERQYVSMLDYMRKRYLNDPSSKKKRTLQRFWGKWMNYIGKSVKLMIQPDDQAQYVAEKFYFEDLWPDQIFPGQPPFSRYIRQLADMEDKAFSYGMLSAVRFQKVCAEAKRWKDTDRSPDEDFKQYLAEKAIWERFCGSQFRLNDVNRVLRFTTGPLEIFPGENPGQSLPFIQNPLDLHTNTATPVHQTTLSGTQQLPFSQQQLTQAPQIIDQNAKPNYGESAKDLPSMMPHPDRIPQMIAGNAINAGNSSDAGTMSNAGEIFNTGNAAPETVQNLSFLERVELYKANAQRIFESPVSAVRLQKENLTSSNTQYGISPPPKGALPTPADFPTKTYLENFYGDEQRGDGNALALYDATPPPQSATTRGKEVKEEGTSKPPAPGQSTGEAAKIKQEAGETYPSTMQLFMQHMPLRRPEVDQSGQPVAPPLMPKIPAFGQGADIHSDLSKSPFPARERAEKLHKATTGSFLAQLFKDSTAIVAVSRALNCNLVIQDISRTPAGNLYPLQVKVEPLYGEESDTETLDRAHRFVERWCRRTHEQVWAEILDVLIQADEGVERPGAKKRRF